MEKEFTERPACVLVERSRFERCSHMLQPGGALGRVNFESRVRFAQAQPPSVLGFLFIAAEELNEESGELFGGAAEALTGE